MRRPAVTPARRSVPTEDSSECTRPRTSTGESASGPAGRCRRAPFRPVGSRCLVRPVRGELRYGSERSRRPRASHTLSWESAVDTELVTLTRSVVEQFVCLHDFFRLHRPESCNSDTKRETPAPLPFLPDGSRHGSARTGNAPRRGFPCTTAIHGPRPRIDPDFRTVAGLFAAQPTNKPKLPGEQRMPEKTNKRRYSPPDAERQNRRSVPLRRAICSQTSDYLPGAFAAMRSQTQVG